MTVTLNDIAEKAGVSVSTVSRVLNRKADRYRISAKTSERIMRAAKELNYRPNHIARGLRLKRTNTLGVIAPDISNPFFAHIIKQVQKTAYELGYTLVVCNSNEDLDLEVEQINLLYRKRVDGLVAMPVGQNAERFQEWIDTGIPLVLLDRGFDDLEVTTVAVDNRKGAFDAVEHLIEYGHRRIAVILGLRNTTTTEHRLDGYLNALRAFEIPIDPNLIVGDDFRRENGYIETKLLLAMEDRPTAIFCTGDLITLGALQAIYEEGLEIPDDISLITFDDFDFAPFLRVPLSAVAQPRELMGEMATKMLVDLINNPEHEPKRVALKPLLIPRKSVGPPSSPSKGRENGGSENLARIRQHR